ncbi:hypothetical protein Godav_012261 [Gossypium davidsonii]|uniref:RING-type domain-containing protein n=2 Tax=Gossypium TaxID=3633 RepID=A0A7J8RDZ6_GOSDV|nr:hypothetical protein [Gossypium davidsonii]MBA0646702.1 hypothetical protein [Gossypium klotzschianum]
MEPPISMIIAIPVGVMLAIPIIIIILIFMVFLVWSCLYFTVVFILMLLHCFCRDIDEDIENRLPRYVAAVDHAMRSRSTLLDEVPRPITVGTVVKYKIEGEIESCHADCVICLEEFKDGDTCRVLPNCKHMYHQLCIDKWLVKDEVCPLCRGSVYTLELTSSPTT